MRRVGDRAAKDALYDGFAEVAKALASGRRAEIVDVLAQGERSVDEIAAEIGQSVANTSHHLRAMARAGLLTTRRDGTRIFYALASDRVGELWAALRDVAAEHVAGLERLAAAYLGDRDGVEVIDREELAGTARARRGRWCSTCAPRPSSPPGTSRVPGRCRSPSCARHLRALPKDADVVAYCRGPYCVYADDAVRELNRQGLPGSATRSTGSRSGSEPACRWQSGTEARTMAEDLLVDPEALREQVRDKYREVAVDSAPRLPLPHRPAARRPARLRRRRGRRAPRPRRRVLRRRRQPVLAAAPAARRASRRRRLGRRVRLVHRRRPGRRRRPRRRRRHDARRCSTKSRDTADALGFDHVEFREGLAEPLPVEDGWADAVISNGVINLCADKQAVFDGDPPRAQARRLAAVRRHRQRPARAARGAARHRPVDRLNRGWAAPCGLAEDARRRRLHRRPSVTESTPSAAPSARRRRGPTRCTATPSSPADPKKGAFT